MAVPNPLPASNSIAAVRVYAIGIRQTAVPTKTTGLLWPK